MDGTARQLLIETTAHLLERQGYHGTGLNQIVRESGTPRGSLYHYFPAGKEELAATAIAERGATLWDQIELTLCQVADPVAAVDRVLEELAHHFCTSEFCGGAPLAAVTLETSAAYPRLRAACAEAYTGLCAVFEAKLRSGAWPPERAQRLATLIVASIEGAIILCRAHQSAEPLAWVREELHMLLTSRTIT